MEAIGNLIYCVSQTMSILPMILQLPGLLGCIQSSFGTVINVLHCAFWQGTWIDDCIMPAFRQLGIEGGKE